MIVFSGFQDNINVEGGQGSCVIALTYFTLHHTCRMINIQRESSSSIPLFVGVTVTRTAVTARRTSTIRRSSSTRTLWPTAWAASPLCPRLSSLPLLPLPLSLLSASCQIPTDLRSPLTPRSLTLAAPPRSAALRPAHSTSSTRITPTR